MVRAGSWHNKYPGDTRVALDLTRLVSFYDTALAPSLVAHRTNRERWDHRLQNISQVDLAAVKTRLKTVLSSSSNETGSGVDWRTLYRVVVDRYADRLELLEHLLNTTTPINASVRVKTIQQQLRVMLTPYILFSARPTKGSIDTAWAAPVWQACATRHTAHIHASAALRAALTPSERLLLGALDETNREICRLVVRMWTTGVHAGLDGLLPFPPKKSPSIQSAPKPEIPQVLKEWRANTGSLMAWLDWSVWVKCRPNELRGGCE